MRKMIPQGNINDKIIRWFTASHSTPVAEMSTIKMHEIALSDDGKED